MKKQVVVFTCACVIALAGAARGGVVPYVLDLPTFQTSGPGVLILDVGHRYFDVNRHTTNVNIGFSLGLLKKLDVFAGYSFKNKDIVGGGKINLLDDHAADGDFISVSLLAGGGYKDTNEINNSLSLSRFDDTGIEAQTTLDNADRASFFAQAVIQKHLFDNRLSVGIVPTFAQNTNFYGVTSGDDYSAGGGLFAVVYITDRVALCGEGVANITGFGFKYMTYNAGVKYAGYRHTFSLWVGNSAGYSPVEYMAGSTDTTVKLFFAFTREFDVW